MKTRRVVLVLSAKVAIYDVPGLTIVFPKPVYTGKIKDGANSALGILLCI